MKTLRELFGILRYYAYLCSVNIKKRRKMKRIDYIIKNGDSRKTDLILKKLDLMR